MSATWEVLYWDEAPCHHPTAARSYPNPEIDEAVCGLCGAVLTETTLLSE